VLFPQSIFPKYGNYEGIKEKQKNNFLDNSLIDFDEKKYGIQWDNV